MKCHNRQFGEIEYENEHIFTFADGLIGFEQLKQFLVINDADADPFRWLVSVDDEDICFPILDPKFILSTYEVANRFDDATTVAVVASLKDPIEESTVNLRSPILFDAVKRTAKQVILADDRLAIQHQFISEPLIAAVDDSTHRGGA
jgi:flagellar assembly factor FliW